MTSPTRHIRLHATTTEDGKGLRQLQDDLDRAAGRADKLGHSLGGVEGDAKRLDVQIVETRRKIRDLGEEFEATGDTSLFGDLRKERAKLRQLEQISKEAVEDARLAGREIAKGLNAGVVGAFGTPGLGPILIGGLAEFAALAAPAIGAAVAGAVTGAAGLGGIVGGIFAASRDPGVEQAWSQFASNVSSKFFQMGSDIAEPLVNAAGTVEQAFDNLNLEKGFKTVAPYIDDIATGLAGFATNFGIGFNKALGNAGPSLEILRRELPELGDALGYMFSKMSEGEGVAQGLEFLMGTLEGTLKGTGNVVHFLSDEFAKWMGFMANLTGAMEDIPLNPFREDWAKANDVVERFIEKANTGQQVLNGVSRGFLDTSQSIDATATAIRKLDDALGDHQSKMLALSDATLAYKSDVLNLKEAVKEHGTTLSDNTREGIANQQMIDGLVGDLMRERDAAIQAADGNQRKTDKANANYQAQILGLKKMLLQLGFEKAAVDRLVGAYDEIPTRITTTIIQDYQTRGVPAGEHSGLRINETQHRAAGGPVLPDVPYKINERGGETVTFGAAGMVHPASLTPAGAQRIVLEVHGGGTGGFEDFMVNWLRKFVRINGGSVQTAFGTFGR